MFAFEQHFVAGDVDGGHHGLREDHDVGGVEAKVVLFFEKRAGGGVVDGAGHHIPRDGGTVFFLCFDEVFGKAGKQRQSALDGGGKSAFGGVPAESCALAASHGEGGDFAFGDEGFTVGAGLGVAGLVGVGGGVRKPRCGFKVFRDFEFGGLLNVGFDESFDLGPVDAFNFAKQCILLGVGETGMVGKHVKLATGVEGGVGVGVAFGEGFHESCFGWERNGLRGLKRWNGFIGRMGGDAFDLDALE